MSNPIIADIKPKSVTLNKDEEYYFCVCGRSTKQPFCDGSHKQFNDGDIGKEGPGLKPESTELPSAIATPEEPTVAFIHQLAREGLSKLGHHGQMTSMGVPRNKLPH